MVCTGCSRFSTNFERSKWPQMASWTNVFTPPSDLTKTKSNNNIVQAADV